MKRFVLNTATAISLLLCLAAVAVWGRSYGATDRSDWTWAAEGPKATPWTRLSLSWAQGRVRLDFVWNHRFGPDALPSGAITGFRHEAFRPDLGVYAHIDGPPPQFDRFGGVWDLNAEHSTDAFGEYRNVSLLLVVPIYALVILTGALPAVRGIRGLRQRRTAGHCRVCGYDLRHSGPMPRVRLGGGCIEMTSMPSMISQFGRFFRIFPCQRTLKMSAF